MGAGIIPLRCLGPYTSQPKCQRTPSTVADLLCRLEGAPNHTLIRLHGDHFTIVRIVIVMENISEDLSTKLRSSTTFPDTLQLVWYRSKCQNRSTAPNLDIFSSITQESASSETDINLARARRLWNTGKILHHLRADSEAMRNLRAGLRIYEALLRRDFNSRLKKHTKSRYNTPSR